MIENLDRLLRETQPPDRQELWAIPIQESNEHLVDIEAEGFSYEPVYFRQGISRERRGFLRKEVLERLKLAESHLPPEFRLHIWDGYRPLEVQQAMFDDFYQRIQNDHPDWSLDQIKLETLKFAAPPEQEFQKAPPHSTGGSVDLTIIKRSNGEYLDMGTEFDDLTGNAAANAFETVPGKVRENRRLLFSVMTEAGFAFNPVEWWHFDYGNQRWVFYTGNENAVYGRVG